MTQLWYPYTQMKNLESFPCVVKAEGPYLYFEDNHKVLDGISSWWCVVHGYNNPVINKAVVNQLKSYAHVMLGGLTHKPAQILASRLVDITPKGLNHVFFSDSGSVGMEVALKMAIQYWIQVGSPEKSKFVSLKRAYHGDTTGVMSISDPEESMHHLFSEILLDNFFVDAPSHGFNPSLSQLDFDLTSLERCFQSNHESIAAFVVEPLIQGAGGFNIYSPSYLNQAKKLCDRYNILFIFDEVATGFGRTGKLFAADYCDFTPDIMVLSKALTAGYSGLAATLATTTIFESFYGNDVSNAFMHGPTFTGHALGCAAALASLDLFETQKVMNKVSIIERKFSQLSLFFNGFYGVSSRHLGACFAVEFDDHSLLSAVQNNAFNSGLWVRHFDKYIYLMPPYCLSDDELNLMCKLFVDSCLGVLS